MEVKKNIKKYNQSLYLNFLTWAISLAIYFSVGLSDINPAFRITFVIISPLVITFLGYRLITLKSAFLFLIPVNCLFTVYVVSGLIYLAKKGWPEAGKFEIIGYLLFCIIIISLYLLLNFNFLKKYKKLFLSQASFWLSCLAFCGLLLIILDFSIFYVVGIIVAVTISLIIYFNFIKKYKSQFWKGYSFWLSSIAFYILLLMILGFQYHLFRINFTILWPLLIIFLGYRLIDVSKRKKLMMLFFFPLNGIITTIMLFGLLIASSISEVEHNIPTPWYIILICFFSAGSYLVLNCYYLAKYLHLAKYLQK